MAYQHGFNPDALPAHAEPEQAAQLFARRSSAPKQPSPNPSAPTSPSYLNKPPPPLPQNIPPLQPRKPGPPNQTAPQQQQQQQQQQPSGPQAYSQKYAANNTASYDNNNSSNASYSSYYPPRNSTPSTALQAGGTGSNSLSPRLDPVPSNNTSTSRPITPASSQQHGSSISNVLYPNATLSPAPMPASAYNSGIGGGGGGGGGGNKLTSFGGPVIGGAGGGEQSLFPLFRAVDIRGTGQLGEEELSRALVNADYSTFDGQTIRMMIGMFDHDRSGRIGFEEFNGLWGFLSAWRSLFDRFDEDRSGYISYDEYSKALLAFGYHLSPNFVGLLYGMYDRRRDNMMNFDLFVQSCISLKKMTDVFKRYDTDRDGYVTLSFEEFLTEILIQH